VGPTFGQLGWVLGSLGCALLYATAYAGLGALSTGTLRALADGAGPQASEAARVLGHYDAIRARLRLGRIVCFGLAASGAAVLGLRLGHAGPGLSATAAALAYGVLAEVTTTTVRRRATRGALRLLRWCRPLEWAMAPLALPLSLVTRLTERLVPPTNAPPESAAREVEHVIDEGAKDGALAREQVELIRNALEFKDTVAREVMVPRTRVVGFEIATPFEEVLAAVEEHAHSRYPVFCESLDRVEGILYAKDLFRVVRAGRQDVSLDELIRRPVFFCAETQPIGTVLRQMQSRRMHLAIVTDEFGGVSGIVTLEDILEELVGEIEDEHDDDDERVREETPGTYLVDATISVYDLADALGIAPPDLAGEYDSLAGLVLAASGGVPPVGTRVTADPFEIEVLEADERAVSRVRLRRLAPRG